MPTRVPVGSGKYCYTGPTCKLHAAHWEKAAELKLAQANSNLLGAKGFDEFKKAKAAQTKAQADYDITKKGFAALTGARDGQPQDADLQDRVIAAETTIREQTATAVTDFLAAQDPADRAAEVFTTTDKEKLALYSQDPEESVRANLALNPAASISQLHALAHENSERIQANVALNPKVTAATLSTIANAGVNNYVKVLAKAQLAKIKTAKDKAAEDARVKQERAATYTSYAYRGKGGGK